MKEEEKFRDEIINAIAYMNSWEFAENAYGDPKEVIHLEPKAGGYPISIYRGPGIEGFVAESIAERFLEVTSKKSY